MFYLLEKVTTFLQIKPCDMHQLADQDYQFAQLRRKVEGSCTPEFGYIICVINVDNESNASNAQVLEDGSIKIQILFNAIAFKPIVNQVLDVFVTKVEQGFILANAGPAEVKIFEDNILENWRFENNKFVDEDQEINVGTKLRIVVGQVDISSNRQMYITGKMKEDDLGPQDDEEDDYF